MLLDENPFEGLHIGDDSFLNDLKGRYPCPKCGKSRKYFCYTCYVPVAELEGKLPCVKLPLKVDIIKHKHEIDGKSTAAHAAILAPEDVKVFTYPDIPNYTSNVLLIYPSFDAITVDQLLQGIFPETMVLPKGFNKTTLMTRKFTEEDSINICRETCDFPVEKVVFIDSTWNQSKGIFKDERIRKLQCVVIQNRVSQFWRHQKYSPRWYLSTIEAIHQFLIEIHINLWGLCVEYHGAKKCFSSKKLEHLVSQGANSYNGQYDNLLFFFKHMYKLIHTYYDHDMLYAYQRRLS